MLLSNYADIKAELDHLMVDLMGTFGDTIRDTN
jgi:hypothetical protein